jgi:hypothetical protein
MMFWVARGAVPAGGSTFSFSWLPIWFSVTAATFSGISGLQFLDSFLAHLLGYRLVFGSDSIMVELSYVLGPIGLLLMVWVWLRLRCTRYRDMAGVLLAIVALYAIVAAAMYVSGANIPFEERYYRYAGILFFLLLLTAIDRWDIRLAKGLACAVVIVLGLYGLKNFVTSASVQMRTGYYDPITGLSLERVSPAILEYLRSEVARHNFQRPAALIFSPGAFISLPRFRILFPFGVWLGNIDGKKWAGRAEKIFVVLPEGTAPDETEAILRSFINYEFDDWKHTELRGMAIYTQ